MEEEKKKMIMIAAIVICLLLAAVITAMRLMKPGAGSIESISESEMMWVKCINPKCGAEYQMSVKDYYAAMQGGGDTVPDGQTRLGRCKECGRDSLVKAIKCKKCGHVFVEGSVPDDFSDRCPKCKYSEIEDLRNQARQQ